MEIPTHTSQPAPAPPSISAEFHDAVLLGETALAGIPLLVTSDKHLLNADAEALALAFQDAPVQSAHPKALARGRWGEWRASGGGVKAGVTLGETDEFGFNVTKDRVHIHDLHGTLLHLLGFDHTRLYYKFQGLDMRLTGVAGKVVDQLLA